MKDTYGNVPVVGDKIVYGVRHGSSMSMFSAVVLTVEETRMRVSVTDNSWWRAGFDKPPVIRETWLRSSNFVIV